MSLDFLPSNWIGTMLGELSSLIQYGLNSDSRTEYDGYLYLRISDINDEGNVDLKNPKYVSSNVQNIDKYVLKAGDIVIARSGSVGRGFVYQKSENPWVFASYLIRFRVDQSLINSDYIGFFMRSFFYHQYIDRMSRSVAQPNINSKELAKLPIPLPPLPEQKRIVAILREADEIRRLRQQANNRLKELFRSLFFHWFGTGRPTSKYLNTIKLRKLLEIPLASGFSPNANDEPPGIPVFGLGAVTDYGLDLKKIKYYPVASYQGKGDDLKVDDILITRSNTQELVGKVARYRGVPAFVIYPDLMIRIRLKEPEDSPYIENFLRSVYMTDLIRRLARGTSGSMKKISQEDIYNFDILYPPEQDRRDYANQVRKIEQLWEQYSGNSDRLDDLFQSLLAQAFSGELTAPWREQHREELATAAAERDRLLNAAQPAIQLAIEEQAIEELDEIVGDRPPSDHSRYQLLRELSHEQQHLYQIITQQTGYFTAESLSNDEENRLSLTTARRGLELLAESGLVISVSLPVVPTSGTAVYVPVHRQPKPTDEIRLADLALMEGNTV